MKDADSIACICLAFQTLSPEQTRKQCWRKRLWFTMLPKISLVRPLVQTLYKQNQLHQGQMFTFKVRNISCFPDITSIVEMVLPITHLKTWQTLAEE